MTEQEFTGLKKLEVASLTTKRGGIFEVALRALLVNKRLDDIRQQFYQRSISEEDSRITSYELVSIGGCG